MPSYSGPDAHLPPQRSLGPGEYMYPQTDPFMKVTRPVIEPPPPVRTIQYKLIDLLVTTLCLVLFSPFHA